MRRPAATAAGEPLPRRRPSPPRCANAASGRSTRRRATSTPGLVVLRALRRAARRCGPARLRRPGHAGRGVAQRRAAARAPQHVPCAPRAGVRPAAAAGNELRDALPRARSRSWRAGGRGRAGARRWSRTSSCAGSARRCSAARRAGRRRSRPSGRGARSPGPRNRAGAADSSATVVDGRGRCALRLEADPGWVRTVEAAQLVLTGPDGREHVQRRLARDRRLRSQPRHPAPSAVVAAHARRAGALPARRCACRCGDGAAAGRRHWGRVGFRTHRDRHGGRRLRAARQRRACVLPRRRLDAAGSRQPALDAAGVP